MIFPFAPSTAMEPILTQTRRSAANSRSAERSGCRGSGSEGGQSRTPSEANPPQYSGRNSICAPDRAAASAIGITSAMALSIVGMGRVWRQAICKRSGIYQNFMYAFLSMTKGWRSDIWNLSNSSRAIMSRSCWLSGSSIESGIRTHPLLLRSKTAAEPSS